MYQWHLDVFDLPDGAVRLARSERSENQAFRYGERTWGLQFHPEVDLPLYQGWIKNWQGAPERMGLDPDALEASIAAGSPDFTEPLFGAFCSVCVAASCLAARIPLAPVAGRTPGAVRAAVGAAAECKQRESHEGDKDEDDSGHV